MALKQICSIIQNQIFIETLDMGPVIPVHNSEKLLSMQAQGNLPAVYFLDIDLEEQIDGFTLALRLRRIDPRGFIIFVTGREDLAFKTFQYRLEAMDYIVKGDLSSLESRIHKCLISIKDRLQNQNNAQGQYYTLKIFDTIRHFPVRKILYFTAEGQKHRITLHTDNESITFFGSLQSVEEGLGTRFFRSHRSCLINLNRINTVHLKENTIELDNGETCPLSRSAKKAILQRYTEKD